MEAIEFTVYGHPVQQGSKTGFVIPGTNRVNMTDQNHKKLKPWRQEVTRTAIEAQHQWRRFAGKHCPVRMELDFYFAKPVSKSKKVIFPAVKPDIDKLIRSSLDALTGVLFYDDAQVVEVTAKKFYGTPERLEVRMMIAAPDLAPIHETQFTQA